MQAEQVYTTGNLLRRFLISTGILCLILVIVMLLAMRQTENNAKNEPTRVTVAFNH